MIRGTKAQSKVQAGNSSQAASRGASSHPCEEQELRVTSCGAAEGSEAGGRPGQVCILDRLRWLCGDRALEQDQDRLGYSEELLR